MDVPYADTVFRLEIRSQETPNSKYLINPCAYYVCTILRLQWQCVQTVLFYFVLGLQLSSEAANSYLFYPILI